MIPLKLKCPVCSKSLMDKEKIINGKPSVKLNIDIQGKEGHIWLSSIYGDYKYETDIEIPDDAIVRFFCPVCGDELKAENKCDICSAPMIPLNLEEGGRVRFCSRKGCTNHVIEFKNPEIALKLLYDTYSLDNKINKNEINYKNIEKVLQKQLNKKEAEREVIKNGTFLYPYCPQCKHTLIKDNMIELEIVNKNDEKGLLQLSPYLNIFNHKSTINLPEGEPVKEIHCPHCNESIIINENCPICNSKVAHILVTSSLKLVEFKFCSKSGCKWHGIDKKDEQTIILEDSDEW
ncbi:hypothetical protein KAU43_06985 [candidate division WOR-3 bacterium]|nr:hypothetical protein [candidate division WOR-3 bacterium]